MLNMKIVLMVQGNRLVDEFQQMLYVQWYRVCEDIFPEYLLHRKLVSLHCGVTPAQSTGSGNLKLLIKRYRDPSRGGAVEMAHGFSLTSLE